MQLVKLREFNNFFVKFCCTKYYFKLNCDGGEGDGNFGRPGDTLWLQATEQSRFNRIIDFVSRNM